MTKFIIKLFGYAPSKKVLTRPNGRGGHWYMAFDVCKLLGISNYSDAVNKPYRDPAYTLKPSEHKLSVEYTGAAKREILMVNAIGVLKLIMQSNPAINAEIRTKALAEMRALNIKLTSE